jgi:hypothetical protein
MGTHRDDEAGAAGAQQELDRVTNLHSRGKIDDQELQTLVEAIRAVNEKRARGWFASSLISPFEKISASALWGTGIGVIAVLQCAATKMPLGFAGVLDFKIEASGAERQYMLIPTFHNLINIVTIALTFFWGAKIAGARKLRFLDFLGSLAFSRLPYGILAAFLFAWNYFSPIVISLENKNSLSLIFTSFLAICALTWMLILYFQALRHASGLEGQRLWMVYLLGVGIAEFLSFGLCRFVPIG